MNLRTPRERSASLRAMASVLVIAGAVAVSDQLPFAVLVVAVLGGIAAVFVGAALLDHLAGSLGPAARYRRRHAPLAGPRDGARLI